MANLESTEIQSAADIRPVLVKIADHRSPPSTHSAIGEFSDLLRGEPLGSRLRSGYSIITTHEITKGAHSGRDNRGEGRMKLMKHMMMATAMIVAAAGGIVHARHG